MELPLRIVVLHPPPCVLFAVQEGRSELLLPTEADNDQIAFEFAVRVDEKSADEEPNFLGAFVQGPRSRRFVYVNSGQRANQKENCWDRRAKVPLAGITWPIVKAAVAKHGAVVEARIDGISRDGGPACGTVALVGKWRVISPAASTRRKK